MSAMPEDDDTLTPQDVEAVEQSPALVIDCDPLLARLVEMTGRDGVTYRLRDDVPTDRLLWAFKLLDIAQAVTRAETWEERESALDERDRERLNVVATIVRHSYPQMTRAAVARVFTAAQMEELLGYFFTNRLLPLLEQRIASAQQEREQASPEAAQEAQPETAQETEPAPQPAPRRAASAGATRGRKR